MTRFLDGPAEGLQLSLTRTPLFLRVCHDADAWDALDMLDDEPGDDETLYAYRRVGKPTSMHIDYTDKVTRRRAAKWLLAAEYRVVPDQPSAMTMRDSDLWRQWCTDRQQQEIAAREQAANGTRQEPGVEGCVPPVELEGGVRPAPDAGDV